MADAAIAILEGLREPPTVEEIPVGGPRPPPVPEMRVSTWMVIGGAAIAFFAGKKLGERAM